MTLQQIRYFVTVARLGSFRRAAKRLYVSQPALSSQIHILETELGAPLLRRQRPNVELAPLGEKILNLAELILAYETAILREGQAHRRYKALRVTAIHGAVVKLLPGALIRFRGRHPEAQLEVTEAGSLAVARAVAEGDCDFGIAADAGALDAHGSFKQRRIMRSELVACRPRSASVLQLPAQYQPFISLPDGYLLHEIMRTYLRRFPSQTVIYTSSTEAALKLVAEGVGVSILPRYIVDHDIHGVAAQVDIGAVGDEVPRSWTWNLIWDYNRKLNRVDEAFVAAVTDASAEDAPLLGDRGRRDQVKGGGA